MSSILPTLPKLGVKSLPPDLDAKSIAYGWFASFSQHVEAGNVDGVLSLLTDDAYWRDLLVLTWDFRTFSGVPSIKQFLTDRLQQCKLQSFKIRDEYLGLQCPYPDVAWIQFLFDFEAGDTSNASGVVRLVPQANGSWKGHCVLTNLESLKGFPEKTGPLRDPEPNHGLWTEERRREAAFEDSDPTVLIVGGGQSGLVTAVRLKALGISCLVVEKHPRVGDNWRTRYEALCLHDPVWYDHLPFIPFPSTWPVYTPAKKLANWLEGYADAMEVNVWTSSTVVSALPDADNKWTVKVQRSSGEERVFKVNHVVLATGFAGGTGNVPHYPGMDKFRGQVLHSLQHGKAEDHIGKKVVVIGSCTSAHDICVDYYNHGVDVTMFQRSSTCVMSTKHGIKTLMEGLYEENGPPTDVADIINASFSNLLMEGIGFRQMLKITELDKGILEGLKARGFRTNLGYKDAGVLLLAWAKAGGYYLDVGASQMIIDGKIKLKNDSQIERFTETGLLFEDGSELTADVVLFATGLGDIRNGVVSLCGDDVGRRCGRIWGMDEEGEINGIWREPGIRGLWPVMGNLALCRFYSKHLAMQIKLIEEGLFTGRYSHA
ncbi:hypothetical protein EDD85DRAFT_824912 [Armillaria nabsnona]|nr:hypothetical protein EDD85DRAFT_824912 [Armillaria nabsnona]